jgi:hypothetical protein
VGEQRTLRQTACESEGIEMRSAPPTALIQIVVTVVLVVILAVTAEVTQALWLYYIVFAVLGLSLLLSWLQARRR